jgi:hypothetical protein
MQRALLITLSLLFMSTVWAAEVEGINVPESAVVSGKSLQLNGAGVRTKFFFDIYVGALYLPQKTTAAEEALTMPGPKQVSMTFIYEEVAREKLVSAWDEGFRLNQSAAEVAALKERLEQFNALFVTAHRGDTYLFNFNNDDSTSVVLNGREAGRISGADFQDALLAVWLGERPADNGLKSAMLGD